MIFKVPYKETRKTLGLTETRTIAIALHRAQAIFELVNCEFVLYPGKGERRMKGDLIPHR